jgi:hypothetical protein
MNDEQIRLLKNSVAACFSQHLKENCDMQGATKVAVLWGEGGGFEEIYLRVLCK